MRGAELGPSGVYTEDRMVAFLESERSSDAKRLVEASFEELKAMLSSQ